VFFSSSTFSGGTSSSTAGTTSKSSATIVSTSSSSSTTSSSATTSASTSSNSSTSASSSSSSSSASSSSSSSSSPDPTNYLYTKQAGDHLQVFSIEQTNYYGDATLFKYGNFEILIDGGNQYSATQLKDYLSTYCTDHVLDVVVLTHSHSDHYGGFTYGTTAASKGGTLADAGITSVGHFVDSGWDNNSYWTSLKNHYVTLGATDETILSLIENNIYDSIWNIAPSCSIQWLYSSTYTASTKNSSSSNNNSVLCDLKFGTYEWVMMGDAQDIEVNSMLSYYSSKTFVKSGDSVVFKACHHCSGTTESGNTSELMNFLSPKFGFTSSGIIACNSASMGVAINNDPTGPADTPSTAQHPFKNAATAITNKTGAANFFWNGTAGTIDMSLDENFSSFKMAGEGRKYGYGYKMNGSLVDSASEKSTPLFSTKWATTSAFAIGSGGTL